MSSPTGGANRLHQTLCHRRKQLRCMLPAKFCVLFHVGFLENSDCPFRVSDPGRREHCKYPSTLELTVHAPP